MPAIHHALLIAAPVQVVYEALTTQHGLAGWWTPAALANAEVNSTAIFPFGDEYFKEMKIIRLINNEEVRWHCMKGDNEWIGTTLLFRLESKDTIRADSDRTAIRDQAQQSGEVHATLLRFEHADWRNATLMFAECSYTWALFLRSLKLLCETGKGSPWPDQHRVHNNIT